MRDYLEPVRHDGNGIDGIAGKKEGQRNDLPDTHETLSGFDGTGYQE